MDYLQTIGKDFTNWVYREAFRITIPVSNTIVQKGGEHNTMKKFATAVGTVSLFAAALVPAFAAGNNCTNGTTGPYSTDYCTIKNESSVSVENKNDAQISNNITGNVNTGGNTASYNTLGGDVVTGDATSNTTVSNLANVNTTTVTGGAMGGANMGANDTTGPFSDNRADISNKQRVDVVNDNYAHVDNVVDVSSNTGDNAANDNTGPSSVRTGDAWMKANVNTHVNDNETTVNAGSVGAEHNSAVNDVTGPFSTDYVTIKNKNNVDVTNDNYAHVGNWVTMAANSGDNSASDTTLGGKVRSGDAVAGVGINNEGNINTTRVMSSMGGFSNVAGTEVSGPGSDDRSTIENRQHSDVVNSNDSSIWNNAYVVSDSGYNAADYNTYGGMIHSGLASMWQNVMTHFNDSWTGIGQ